MVKKALARIYLFLVMAFLYAPIVVLMVFSFNDSRLKGSWVGFTLKWYRELFNDRMILQSFRNTLLIAIIATIIATIIGTFAAIGIFSMKKFKRELFLNTNYLPVLNPDIVTAISLMVLFNIVKIKFGFSTLLLSHIVFTVPYIVLSVLPKLKQMDPYLIEAAMDLGAKPSYILRKVIFPSIMPGIISGALLGFTLSLDDFVISFFNTGNGFNTLSITVFSMAKKGINPAINALSTIMFLVILVLLVVIYLQSNKKKGRKI